MKHSDFQALQAFLRDLEPRLSGLNQGRRRRLLEELRDHLSESVEAALHEDPGLSVEGWLGRLQPGAMAEEILRAEASHFYQRTLAVLAACLALALTNAAFMLASGRPTGHALAFGAGYGFSVGFTLFWLRRRLLGTRGWIRWAMAFSVGALAGIPWAFMLSGQFAFPMVFYGAVSGYLLERFSRSMRWTVWLADNLWISCTAFLLAGLEWHWDPRRVGIHLIPWMVAYHAFLQGGMALGVTSWRQIGLWFLERSPIR